MTALTSNAEPAAHLDLQVYNELKLLANHYFRRQRPGHTLQPTALVNEAYIRLARQAGEGFRGLEHFLAVAATAMRQILVDHARRHLAAKRGGGSQKVTLGDVETDGDSVVTVLALDEALKKLEKVNPRHKRLIELRVFGGLTVSEAAQVLEVSARTINTDWRFIKAWLRRELL